MHLAGANLIVGWQNNETAAAAEVALRAYGLAVDFSTLSSIFSAVAVPFTASPLSFSPITSLLISPQVSPPQNASYAVAVPISPPPKGFTSADHFIASHVSQYRTIAPAAYYVIMGGSYLAGGYQFVRERSIDMRNVTVPVIQVSLGEAAAMSVVLATFSGQFVVTATDKPENDWIPIRKGPAVVAISILFAAWNLLLIAFAGFLVYRSGLQKNVGSAVIFFDTLACLGACTMTDSTILGSS